ncbi:MliC family protein [Cruoricaptor ignavus]|uniref:MliC family protein n=1 Tax=Cruoricaptor ignavus TaxID=1118202 RepID=A0A7M1T2N5_9FLAO|nr:MliC family protein [Cruoricaptor ignavus]QOR73173.1 MliC family protein [Cruoricaptor ignavus]
MKNFIMALAAAVALASCAKKESESMTTETGSAPVTETQAAPAATYEMAYQSEDGRTRFHAVYNPDQGTARVTNEAEGKTYEMQTAQSASGAKFTDKEGYFFWTHQGEFEFGKGEETLVKGREIH